MKKVLCFILIALLVACGGVTPPPAQSPATPNGPNGILELQIAGVPTNLLPLVQLPQFKDELVKLDLQNAVTEVNGDTTVLIAPDTSGSSMIFAAITGTDVKMVVRYTYAALDDMLTIKNVLSGDIITVANPKQFQQSGNFSEVQLKIQSLFVYHQLGAGSNTAGISVLSANTGCSQCNDEARDLETLGLEIKTRLSGFASNSEYLNIAINVVFGLVNPKSLLVDVAVGAMKDLAAYLGGAAISFNTYKTAYLKCMNDKRINCPVTLSDLSAEPPSATAYEGEAALTTVSFGNLGLGNGRKTFFVAKLDGRNIAIGVVNPKFPPDNVYSLPLRILCPGLGNFTFKVDVVFDYLLPKTITKSLSFGVTCLPAVPVLAVHPTELHFRARYGQTQTLGSTLENQGRKYVTLKSLSDSASWIQTQSRAVPGWIPARARGNASYGGFLEVKVTCQNKRITPEEKGAAFITSDDPSNPKLEIPVYRECYGNPSVEAAKLRTKVIGTVLNKTVTYDLSFRNGGDDNLTYKIDLPKKFVQADIPTNLSSGPVNAEQPVAPKATRTVPITLTCPSNAPVSGTITITGTNTMPDDQKVTVPINFDCRDLSQSPLPTFNPVQVKMSAPVSQVAKDKITITNDGQDGSILDVKAYPISLSSVSIASASALANSSSLRALAVAKPPSGWFPPDPSVDARFAKPSASKSASLVKGGTLVQPVEYACTALTPPGQPILSGVDIAYTTGNTLADGSPEITVTRVPVEVTCTDAAPPPPPPPSPAPRVGNVSVSSLSDTATSRSTTGSLSFSNVGNANLTFSASSNNSWLQVITTNSSALTPGSSRTLILVGLCSATPGQFSGLVTITSNDPASPTVVPVTLKCVAPSLVGPTPSGVVLTGKSGSSTDSQTVTVSNSSTSNAISYQPSITGSLSIATLNINPAFAGTLTLNPGASQTFTLSADCLPDKFGTESVTLVFNDLNLVGSGSATVTVTCKSPKFGPALAGLSFTANDGETAPTKSFTVTNVGNEDLSYATPPTVTSPSGAVSSLDVTSGTGAIAASRGESFDVTATCSSVKTTSQTDNYTIAFTQIGKPNGVVQVPVSVQCNGVPRIALPTASAKFRVKVNQATINAFGVQNTGPVDMNVNFSQSANITLNSKPSSIAAGSSASVGFTATCPAQYGVYHETVTASGTSLDGKVNAGYVSYAIELTCTDTVQTTVLIGFQNYNAYYCLNSDTCPRSIYAVIIPASEATNGQAPSILLDTAVQYELTGSQQAAMIANLQTVLRPEVTLLNTFLTSQIDGCGMSPGLGIYASYQSLCATLKYEAPLPPLP